MRLILNLRKTHMYSHETQFGSRTRVTFEGCFFTAKIRTRLASILISIRYLNCTHLIGGIYLQTSR